MRTTLTLDAEVLRLVEETVHRERKTMKQVVNEALLRALSSAPSSQAKTSYRVVPHDGALRPGFDSGALNRLVDELDETEFLAGSRIARK